MKHYHFNEWLVPYFLLTFLFISWIGYTAFGISQQYSYWADEIFSVVTSSKTIFSQLEIYLSDVHPPLYQFVLSAWVKIFGTSEAATRSLSAFFVLLSLPSFIYLARKVGIGVALLSAIFFLSNSNVYVYSQETRSYGLLLALSLWSTILFLTNERRLFFFVLAALSLTHFFGALLASVIAIWIVIEKRDCPAQRNASIFVFFAAVIWPIIWFLSGNAQNVIGGNFWIQTSPLGSVIDALKAGSPTILSNLYYYSKLISSNFYVFLAILAVICLFILSFILISMSKSSSKEKIIIMKLLFLILGVVANVATISFHTPISTVRNYIVIIPAVSLLLSYFALFLLQHLSSKVGKKILAAALAGFVALSANQTFDRMKSRFQPEENWLKVARKVEQFANANTAYEVYVYQDRLSRDRETSREIRSFYFSKNADVELITSDDIADTPAQSIIVFGHQESTSGGSQECRNAITDELEALDKNITAWFADQSMQCMNGYVIIDGVE